MCVQKGCVPMNKHMFITFGFQIMMKKFALTLLIISITFQFMDIISASRCSGRQATVLHYKWCPKPACDGKWPN